jgi:predicted metalloendopeptidase
VTSAGELLQAMDKSVNPCDDFYQYSCGKWLTTHSIPETESSFSRFGEIRDNVKLELKSKNTNPFTASCENAMSICARRSSTL